MVQTGQTAFESAVLILGQRLRYALQAQPVALQNQVNEIRLRVDRPVTLHTTATVQPLELIVRREDLDEAYRRLCDFSIYAHQEEIRQGYLTIQGGHRVGICGTAVVQQGQIATVRDISSLNLRIARQVRGAADELLRCIGQDWQQGLLLVGPPACGKTTLLRDLARALATGVGGMPKKVAVIDERSELAGVSGGVPQHDLGLCADVLDHYPKGDGILHAVRALSPQVIVCDELGAQEDVVALEQGLHAGVAVIATVHAGSIAQLLQKKQGQTLLRSGAFDTVAMLSGTALCQVTELHKAGDLLDQIGRQPRVDCGGHIAWLHGVV